MHAKQQRHTTLFLMICLLRSFQLACLKNPSSKPSWLSACDRAALTERLARSPRKSCSTALDSCASSTFAEGTFGAMATACRNWNYKEMIKESIAIQVACQLFATKISVCWAMGRVCLSFSRLRRDGKGGGRPSEGSDPLVC